MPPFGANARPTNFPGPLAGRARELPDDMDALDAELGTLRGQTLAMSDGFGAWMRLHVVLLIPGSKPTAVLSDVEFLLLGHSRHPNYLELTVEDVVFGTRGTLRLMFPASGWRLHAVLPAAPACAASLSPAPFSPAPFLAPSAVPQTGAEESAKRKRDDIFRRMFS